MIPQQKRLFGSQVLTLLLIYSIVQIFNNILLSNERINFSFVTTDHEYDRFRNLLLYNKKDKNSTGILPSEPSRQLIVQYAGVSNFTLKENNNTGQVQNYYDQLLDLTSIANQAYAKLWNHDYMIYRGVPFLGENFNETCFELIEKIIMNGKNIRKHQSSPFDSMMQTEYQHCKYNNYSNSRATYNKIIVLEKLLHDEEYKNRYDQVLLLDSDAMMYDFTRNIANSFIPMLYNFSGNIDDRTDFVVVAHKTNKDDINNTGSVNIGVSLWNLNHPLIAMIVLKWKKGSIMRLRKKRDDDDQEPLQSMLKNIPPEYRERVIRGVSDELGYGKGKFVKHFIRPDFSNWITKDTANKNSTTLDTERLNKIQNALSEVCNRYYPICLNEETAIPRVQ